MRIDVTEKYSIRNTFTESDLEDIIKGVGNFIGMRFVRLSSKGFAEHFSLSENTDGTKSPSNFFTFLILNGNAVDYENVKDKTEYIRNKRYIWNPGTIYVWDPEKREGRAFIEE